MHQHVNRLVTNTSSTVKKALQVLESVATSAAGLTLSHITRATALNKATAVRLCATLESAGFLERDAHMVYRLGRRIWQLGQVYRQQFGFEDIVRPSIASLRDRTGESASFYVREGTERVCLIRENSRQIIRHHMDEGTRLSLAHGVVGRVLLAFSGARGAEFDDIRAQGSLCATGREPDTASVAAPVLDAEGAPVGAVVVSGPRSRFDGKQQRAALELVLATCRDIGAALPSATVPASPRPATPTPATPKPGSVKSDQKPAAGSKPRAGTTRRVAGRLAPKR